MPLAIEIVKGHWYRMSQHREDEKVCLAHVREHIRVADDPHRIVAKFSRIDIGRNSGNDIILDDMHVSRWHCELEERPGTGWCLRRTKAAAATVVERDGLSEAVGHLGFELRERDRIVLGGTTVLRVVSL